MDKCPTDLSASYAELVRLLDRGDLLPAAWLLQSLFEHAYEQVGSPGAIAQRALVVSFDPDDAELCALRETFLRLRIRQLVRQGEIERAAKLWDALARYNPQALNCLASVILECAEQALDHFRPCDATHLLRHYLWHVPSSPSLIHSRVMGLALRLFTGSEAWRLAPFAAKWGLHNLREEDWTSTEATGIEAASSLAMALFARLGEVVAKPSWHLDDFPLHDLAPYFEQAIRRGVYTEGILMNYARMLSCVGEYDRSRELFLCLLPPMRSQFYYWRDFSSAYRQVPSIRIGMLFLALYKSPGDPFAGKTRKRLSELLWQEGYHEAAAEQAQGLLAYRGVARRAIQPQTLRGLIYIGSHPQKPGSSRAVAKGFMAEAWEALLGQLTYTTYTLEEQRSEAVLVFGGPNLPRVQCVRVHFPALRNAQLGDAFSIALHSLGEGYPVFAIDVQPL